MKKALVLTFCALVANFFVILYAMFNPGNRNLTLTSIVLFFFLGIILIFLTLRQKIKGLLKKFLILTGGSATGFFISAFLHNAIYAIFMQGAKDEVLFFIIAIFICPILFLVGVIGSIVLFIKTRRAENE